MLCYALLADGLGFGFDVGNVFHTLGFLCFLFFFFFFSSSSFLLILRTFTFSPSTLAVLSIAFLSFYFISISNFFFFSSFFIYPRCCCVAGREDTEAHILYVQLS